MGIREIAKQANVSISTVSYALNGSDKITEETRARILAIAKKLHYTPSLAARTLKKQATNIIGMYVHEFGGDFYTHVIDGVAQTLKKHHYELIVCSGGQRSRSFIDQRLVDGAIILDPTFSDDILAESAKVAQGMVVMDRETHIPNVSQVLLDNEGGARLAVDALIESGVDHYVFVTGPSDSHDSRVRLDAALGELAAKTHQAATVIPGDFTISGGHAVASMIADLHQTNIGIFALNDELAIGLTERLPEFGLNVGQNIKLIGLDNDMIGEYLRPALTTIDYSKYHWGEVAAEALLKQLAKPGTITDEMIRTKIIHRHSLGEEAPHGDRNA
ncbi:LacI family DNA-binding transcriptional regulator [Lacticaseibacillus nasuensis]|uniref:LacI family DNA-binding transcriptional regulator n=1 Tax=Lacticaseibacillus nasuensis TaxID=944671 RepID=UPI0022484BB0|nr:LacI family DNA-binding transcriptional regulator [Lacticaseibacillus nasuensis]MCX2455066.1 LacI family transcriptional regulator [Lacticaseibacillus nasuensis]